MIELVVDGYTEQLTPSGDWVISAYVISDYGTPSAKVRAGGSGVMKDGTIAIVNSIAAASPSLGAFVQTAPVNFVLNSSALKNRVDGVIPLLEGDESISTVVNGTITPPGGSPVPGTINVVYKALVSGQTKVRAV